MLQITINSVITSNSVIFIYGRIRGPPRFDTKYEQFKVIKPRPLTSTILK